MAQGGINALISLKLMMPCHLTGVERWRAHPTTDAPRDRATGNHLPRRLLLRVPRVRAHPKEQARGDGVSCGIGGGERGGGRSSAFVSFAAAARGRANQCARDALREVANALHTDG